MNIDNDHMFTDAVHKVRLITDRIEYKEGWELIVGSDSGKVYLQWAVDDVCAHTGEPVLWKSGKRYLSQHMCRQEIVGVAFDLAKAAEMHELHEFFKYKGVAIYNPHLDPDQLAKFASNPHNINQRKNPMTMEEPSERDGV